MSRSNTALVLVVIVLGALVSPAILASTAASAEEPENADDLFETLRAMDGTAALDTYGEFETMRAFALSKTQAGALSDDDRADLDAVVETLETFTDAYDAADEGAYDEAFETARTTESVVADLGDGSQAALAELALTRFYEDLGDELHERSERTDTTPDRLALLSKTVTAYERADRVDVAAEFELQVERLEAAYTADRERIDAAKAAGDDALESCSDCDGTLAAIGGNGLGLFERYAAVMDASVRVDEGERLAATHGLTDDEDALAALGDELGEAQSALGIASAAVSIGYGLVVGAIAAVTAIRLVTWRQAVETVRVAGVVPPRESGRTSSTDGTGESAPLCESSVMAESTTAGEADD